MYANTQSFELLLQAYTAVYGMHFKIHAPSFTNLALQL